MKAWPQELTFERGARRLVIRFDDGFAGAVPFDRLRAASPSAETRGHGGAPPPPLHIPPDLTVTGAEPVGRYAVRILFSDGHRTGLYPWPLLRALAENHPL